jgi:ribosomal protein S12 methylthiotransferase accessory factor
MEFTARPLGLSSSPKAYTYDQDKASDPHSTVMETARKIAGLDDLGHAQLNEAGTPVEGAFSYQMVTGLTNTTGKGLTPLQAQASALMELAERYSWLRFDYAGYTGYRISTHRQLETEGLRTVERSYFTRNFVEVEDAAAIQEEVADLPLKWIAATTLPQEEAFYYPINWHNLLYSSNGLAAGNSLEEAVVQAACELIERENVYRFFVERQPGWEIDLDSLEHPAVRTAIDNARAADITLRVTEISSTFGIPTFIAHGVSARDEGQLTHSGVGQGCHLDPIKALIRSLAEYFEGYASVRGLQERSGLDMKTARRIVPDLHHGFHAFYNADMLDTARGTKRLDELEDLSQPDILDEVHLLAARFAAQGWPMTVVDKTHPKLRIPTVRVFVPQCRSCLTTDFLHSPAGTISAAYFEAGNREAGQRWIGEMLRVHPSFALVRKSGTATRALAAVLNGAQAGPSAGGDYLQSLMAVGSAKRNAAGVLEVFGQNRDTIMPALDFLDPPEIVLD